MTLPSRQQVRRTRREFLRIGGIGAMGLVLPRLLRAESEGKPVRGRGKAKACILLYLHGGQSQLETFDPKPAAPPEIRGEFKPIATRVPGLQICEHLPKLARLADKFALIRSMTHGTTNHNPAGYYVLSGIEPNTNEFDILAARDDFPHPGAVLAKLGNSRQAIPPFVQLSPSNVGDGGRQMPGQSAGFLGGAFDPFKVVTDPNAADFDVEGLSLADDVSASRLDRRRQLLEGLGSAARVDQPAARAIDPYYERAFQLITSPASRRAFRLDQEPARLRDRYGRHTPGQSLLLARRLIEAGVRLVTVVWGGPLQAPDDYWDTHKQHFPKQRDKLLPRFDQCLSALLEDLDHRGLLETTLVVSMSEFGRTPRIGQDFGNATDATGRDHWPQCYSMLLAGGGVCGGAVLGKSDRYTIAVTERPVRPEDLTTTIYFALGIEGDAELHDRFGRPLPLTRGQPVRELFA